MIGILKPEKPGTTVIGAGPYGLSASISLAMAGVQVHTHGTPMESWIKRMPEGMILRSTRVSTSIASPGNRLSIAQYERQTGMELGLHLTRDQFIAYGQWVQRMGDTEVDEIKVRTLYSMKSGFSIHLEDGRSYETRSVVLAPGINLFPHIPEVFATFPKSLVSHSSCYSSFAGFANQEVIIIGKGQSALESAALMHESGIKVEIITRGSRLAFIRKLPGRFDNNPRIYEFLYPPTDLAGPPHNWAIADPILYRNLSKAGRTKLFQLVGPIGSTDLESKLQEVLVTTQVEVVEAREHGNKLCLDLSDGTTREVDHVLLATGFRPDIRRCDFLSDDLKAAIEHEDGFPKLTLGYESTNVKGLYITGALASRSQGPINRFVCGTYPVCQYLTEAITGSRIGYPDEGTSRLVTGRRLLYRAYQLTNRFSGQ